jgi:hypothetical protein
MRHQLRRWWLRYEAARSAELVNGPPADELASAAANESVTLTLADRLDQASVAKLSGRSQTRAKRKPAATPARGRRCPPRPRLLPRRSLRIAVLVIQQARERALYATGPDPQLEQLGARPAASIVCAGRAGCSGRT